MPEVYDVSVRFMRRVQMKEYEPAECEISLKAQIKDGEDATVVASNLAAQARATVIATLKGEKPPALVVAADSSLVVPEGSTLSVNAPTETETEAPAEKPKRKRRTKAEMAAAKAEEEAAAAPAEEPVEEEVYDTPDIPDDPDAQDIAEATPPSPAEIQSLMSAYVANKKLAVPAIKALITKVGGAGRVVDVAPDKMQALHDAIVEAAGD